MSNQPERRKPYNRDITARNKAKERERAQRREDEKISWDELTGLHGACSALFSGIPDLAMALRNPLVAEHATAEEKGELVRRGKSMTRDVQDFKAKLAEIATKHEGKSGPVSDDLQGLEIMSVGLEYNEWQESFNRVIIPTANDITETIANIVERVEKSMTPATEETKENDAT